MSSSNRVHFHCPACLSKLKAPERMVGTTGPCPHCSAPVLVPPQAPSEAMPVLVYEEGDEPVYGKYVPGTWD